MRRVVAALVALEYAAQATTASRPRGVGPEFAKFYEDSSSFTCISNPKVSIPFSRVNDDYCDCPDGSDEPGTAACAHLSPLSPHTPADSAASSAVNTTAALPGFYCKNKGHISSYVPFTNVNDGICDYDLCCDGSEEWEGIAGKCKDKCDEIGKEWRKHDEARQKAAGNALRKRNELVKEAARLRQQVKDRIQTLGTEIEGSELKVKDLEKELSETQRREAGKVVSGGGASKGGKLGQLVEIGRRRTEELRTQLGSVRGDLLASRTRLEKLEEVLSKFHEEYNPNFNDEGVKRAVKAWEDYIASYGVGSTPNSANERDLEEIMKEDKENGLDWDNYAEEEEDETAVLYSFTNYLPPTLRDWVDSKLRDLRQTLIDNGILASSPSGNANESKKVTDARNRLDAAKKTLEDHRKDLQDNTDDLAKDFGPDDVFRALKGVCVETDSGEYTYELCFLEKTNQKPKKGGGHTNMGSFVRMEKVVVDEELPSNGKGLGSGERYAMKHENGQHCWNGPNRSTTVILACSEENEIWKIMEEEKCVYRMEVGTPAVCERRKKAADSKGKDEL
ncbi:hypothetical protein M409DRAFT_21789 [Zasmidium cellare ATCC 36951]|uniref:Glucosidase 2 subunit beta n=1 Tax=Zasmidium cellare ATCC 36951 TaxID=1080233 RepID=A0A6A6CP39_ZASCE|nr:uncharacterized protein M409DRAFT_21789 [Zasmidium cellare ATCC 36951]KAF2167632.1 hypothetical protein M409DRAFT_21789 [Zasmidium cellare ATCC 36951]